jgi:ATP-dependent DNA helicase RecG
MRPDILNPLFAEVEVLKGVGPALAKPLKRLGLHRVVDLLFHLPTGWIERKRVDTVDMADAGSVVSVLVTPVDYRQGGPRSPFRVHAVDREGNYLTLTYFNNPGWAKKQLPLGEPKIVSGRMEMYGQELQIVHPDYVLEPAEALDLPEREPVYPLSEGLTSRRLADFAAQALARAPDLAEWIEPSLLDRRGWPSWQEALASARGRRASGSPMTRCSPTSSP